jgi:hypothetical protein
LAAPAAGLLLSIEPSDDELSDDELSDDELLLSEAVSSLAAEVVSSDPQALRVTARVEAVASRTPRVRVFFTVGISSVVVLVRSGTGWSPPVVPPDPCEGSGEASAAQVAETGSGVVRCCPAAVPAGGDRYLAITRTECRPLAPFGKGRARSSVCTSPSAVVARTVSW